MKTRIIKIGNSKGIRLPKRVIDLYELNEGAELDIEETNEGIFLKPQTTSYPISWEEAYTQMAGEKTEEAEWSVWDVSSGDGLDD